VRSFNRASKKNMMGLLIECIERWKQSKMRVNIGKLQLCQKLLNC